MRVPREVRSVGPVFVVTAILSIAPGPVVGQATRSGNPLIPGWYADPEAHVFEGAYWIYPTTSAPYDEQTYMDAFSSADLVTWTRHPSIVDLGDVSWGTRALWAPSVVEKDGWYYLFFSANDIQSDDEIGGIGVARARAPDGPFQDHLGVPLIGEFHNGAQPIDPFVFQDSGGEHYLIYGGWRHCNIARLNEDFTGFVPFDDGETFREITPEGYVEGSFMVLKEAGTTSCGPRVGGRVLITRWRTPWRRLPWARSGGSARSSSRTPASPRVPAITRCCTLPGQSGGTSCTTGGRWARQIETTAW